MRTAALLSSVELPLIPVGRGVRKDYYNENVELEGSVWRLNDPLEYKFIIDWRKLNLRHRGLVEATADFIVDRIVSSSASNVMNHFRAICRLQTLKQIQLWSDVSLPEVSDHLRPDWFYEARDGGAWSNGELSHARRWYVFCAKREDSGVSWVDGRSLSTIRIGGDPKAVAVLTNDPKGGPLDDAETTALLQALLAARAERSIALMGLAAVWLCVTLGPNARHLALLREEDFKRIDGRHPEIWVPRIKGKDAHGRCEFRRRKLDAFAVKLLDELIAENAMKRKIAPCIDDDFGLAMFPRETPQAKHLGRPQHAYAMHRTSKEMSVLISSTVAQLSVVSPRTGEILRASPRRFRYTFATRLLREGASLAVVRDLLDHISEETVKAYLNLRGDIVEKLDAALDLELAPVAQAFLGTLVIGEDDAVRGNERTSRIFALDREAKNAEAVGTCGSFSFCGLAAPRACYTCIKFQPWVDGPHEIVLRALLSDREDRKSRGLNGRLVSMNDTTIMAVADVIHRCTQVRGPIRNTPAPLDLDTKAEE